MATKRKRKAAKQEAPVVEAAPVALCPICNDPAHDDIKTARQCPLCMCVAQDIAKL